MPSGSSSHFVRRFRPHEKGSKRTDGENMGARRMRVSTNTMIKGCAHLGSACSSGTGYLGLASSGGWSLNPGAAEWAVWDGSQNLRSRPSF